MSKPSCILAVAQRRRSDTVLLAKAAALARAFGFGLELFLCESEQAYALMHSYAPNGRSTGLNDCVARARQYLLEQRKVIDPAVGSVGIDAACDSPLYESIVAKVRRGRPNLVMKAAGGVDQRNHSAFDDNDWELMRTCPATLALVQGRHWRKRLRIAAAVDVSAEETEGLAAAIMRIARRLALATGGELDLIYAEHLSAEHAESQGHAGKLRSLARQADLDERHAYILAGPPERELAAFATGRDYDVIALGALTHRRVAVQLVGNLTATLVEALDSDFLLIKPDSALRGERGMPRIRDGVRADTAEEQRDAAMRAWSGYCAPGARPGR